jgi:hypothetical protein
MSILGNLALLVFIALAVVLAYKIGYKQGKK